MLVHIHNPVQLIKKVNGLMQLRRSTFIHAAQLYYERGVFTPQFANL